MNELLIVFIILNALNVVIQTAKSLLTINGGKLVAASANAIAYGLYTVVVIYMVCDLPLWEKIVIIGGCNFIGVFAVKWIEQKMRKDKLWKVEVTIPAEEAEKMLEECRAKDLNFSYIDIHRYFLFNFYCPTQEDSRVVRALLKNYHVKYFVNESKVL